MLVCLVSLHLQDYEEFKSLVTCIFPKILDTKSMASTHPFKVRAVNILVNNRDATLPFLMELHIAPPCKKMNIHNNMSGK